MGAARVQARRRTGPGALNAPAAVRRGPLSGAGRCGSKRFAPVFLKQADNKRKDRAVSIAATAIVRPHALPAGVAARRKVDFFAGRGRKW